MGREFISLEEFLNLGNDPGVKGCENCEYTVALPGRGWLRLYETAKESFEKYGEDGPPIGSTVESLCGGFGGGSGTRLTFCGVYEGYDGLFYVKRKGGWVGLLSMMAWWRDIRVIADEV